MTASSTSAHSEPEWEPIEFDDIQRGDRLRVTIFGASSMEYVANHYETAQETSRVRWIDRLGNVIVLDGQSGARIFRYVRAELTPDQQRDQNEAVEEHNDLVAGFATTRMPERAAEHNVVPPTLQETPQAVEEITEPCRFALIREFDVSGSSGTGRIADGVLWTDGSVAVRWRGEHPSTAVWARIEDAVAVHGHAGHTKIRWIDIPPEWFRRAVGLAM